jgi:hypothetical protein
VHLSLTKHLCFLAFTNFWMIVAVFFAIAKVLLRLARTYDLVAPGIIVGKVGCRFYG